MERLNRVQAMDIFTRNAVLIGDRDVLPMDRALELLGYSAMSYIADRHTIERPLYGRYDAGGGCIQYLTREGYMLAVTYNNIMQVQDKRQRGGKVVHMDARRFMDKGAII